MKRVFFLFFTIFFGFMCKAGDFTYTTSGTNATITKYNGSEKSVVFPTQITDNTGSYDVTSIIGVTSVINNTNVEEIYIPSGISLIKNVTNSLKSLKTIVIENGKINMENPFTITSFNTTLVGLDNIIILSSCDYTSDQFIKYNPNYLLKTGEIIISYKIDERNEKTETIQMYLFDIGWTSARPFGVQRFNYLLSALQKSGKDISQISKIDLSKMSENTTNIGVNFTFNDNYNPSSELSSGAEVIISETESYTAATRTTTIIDKENFTAPQYSILTDITYNRSNTLKWNSVCLPFDIKESDFGGTCKIYTVTSATNSQINLTRVETPETTVAAGTPCFIYSSENKWELNLSNVSISYNAAPKTLDVDGNWQVIGSFTNETIGAGKYKLNSSGTEFGITNYENATVTAFRCYIAPTSTRTNAPAQLSVNINEEASITLVPNDAEPQKVKLYDLMGRPRKEGKQGIFIKSTR